MIGCYYSSNYIVECCCKNDSDKFLGLSIDAIFTAFITIGIFILGFWLNKKNDERKEFDSLIEIKNYFLQLIGILTDSTEKQIKAFQGLVADLIEKTDKDFVIIYSSNFTTSYINEIPNEKLFKIFVSYKSNSVKEEAITLYKDFIINIGLIRNIEKDWKVSFNDFLRDSLKTDEEFNESAAQIGSFTNKLASTIVNRIIPTNDRFLIEFNAIVGKWQKMENAQDKYTMMENLINPLRELCRKTPNDAITLELLQLVMQCRYAFLKKEKIRDTYINLFNHYIEQLKIALIIIKNSIAEIEQLKDIRPSMI